MGGREGGREIRAGVPLPLNVPAFSMGSENQKTSLSSIKLGC